MDSTAERGGRMFAQVHARAFNVMVSFKTQLPFDGLPSWRELRAQPLDAQAAASLVVGVVIGAVVQVTLAHGALDPENVILSAGRILIQGLRTPA